MNANEEDRATPPGVAAGPSDMDSTPMGRLVQILTERLARVPDCGQPPAGPLPCHPALEAWQMTQMSDEQFVEFRAAYGRWVEGQRRARAETDFRVKLTPRRPACGEGAASLPPPKPAPAPDPGPVPNPATP